MTETREYDVEVALVRRGADGWEPLPETGPAVVIVRRWDPVTVRVRNNGAAPVEVAVLVGGHARRLRVLRMPDQLPPGAERLLHLDPVVPDLEKRVVVAYGDAAAVGALVRGVTSGDDLRELADDPAVRVVEFQVVAAGELRHRDEPFRHRRGFEDRGRWAAGPMPEAPGPEAPPGPEPSLGAPDPAEPSLGAPDPAAPDTAAPPPGAPGAPATRSAYGRLDAPASVVAGREFEVVAGIAPGPSPGLVGDAMTLPDPDVRGAYVLSVLVIAEGCRLRTGEAWRNDLAVTPGQPFPTVTLHLTSDPVDGGIGARTVQALYSVDGVTVGSAARPVAVVTGGAGTGAAAAPEPAATGGLFAYTLPAGYPVPDLTIRITTDPTLDDGTLLWHVDSPHASVAAWDARIATNVGDEPREFAKALMRDVNAHEGQPDLTHVLRGHALSIAEQVPPEVFDALRAAAAATTRPAPTVLLLSAEPYVPWELALVDPPLDPAAPPFLGAQAAVGRWVLGTHRPAQPPPHRVTVGGIAVVSGVYDMPGYARLAEAEAEAADLTTAYGATPVTADLPSVLALLGGTPPAQALHFALHGRYDPQGVEDGLKLVDRKMLAPTAVRGSALPHRPFVYLNACQVGAGNAVLGDYAGLAAAFVQAGAAAVLAPLWSIDDGLAREIALRLYPAWFGDAPVGDTLRRERAAFAAVPDPQSATVLAYQFFGHPEMTLDRLEEQ